MKPGILAALLSACLATGCTTLDPVPIAPEALRGEIRAGSLIEPGEAMRVTTKDDRKHDIVVTQVDGEAIRGETRNGGFVVVPVNEVTAIAKRKFSAWRTNMAAYAGIPLLVGTAAAFVLLVFN